MTIHPMLRIFLAACLMGLSTQALACSAAGPNTHVGRILSVDGQAKTLKITDMTTGKPITFALSDALLTRIIGLHGQVIVRYKDGQKGLLVATDVQQ